MHDELAHGRRESFAMDSDMYGSFLDCLLDKDVDFLDAELQVAGLPTESDEHITLSLQQPAEGRRGNSTAGNKGSQVNSRKVEPSADVKISRLREQNRCCITPLSLSVASRPPQFFTAMRQTKSYTSILAG
jgi:hypothetical protein